MDTLVSFINSINALNPATMLLIAIMVFTLWAGIRAQSRPDFDFADVFRDDSGKVSSARMGILVCLAVSSWAQVTAVMAVKDFNAEHLVSMFGIYIVTWSGAKVVEKALDNWLAIRGRADTKAE